MTTQVVIFAVVFAVLLISCVAVTGFIVGRATVASDSGPPEATPASDSGQPAETANSTGGSDGPESPSATTSAVVGVAPGTLIVHYTLDLAKNYEIDISDTKPRPQKSTILGGDGGGDLHYYSAQFESSERVQMATIDKESPTYRDCVGDTRFSDHLTDVVPKSAFCFLGHGYVAAIKILRIDGSAGYVTLGVTVWKGP